MNTKLNHRPASLLAIPLLIAVCATTLFCFTATWSLLEQVNSGLQNYISQANAYAINMIRN